MKYQYQITDINNKQNFTEEKLISYTKTREYNTAIYIFTHPLQLGM